MARGNLDAFMATMVAHEVAVDVADVEKLARTHYGLNGTATRLTGERDENFKLSCVDGAQYVLKLANGAEDASSGDLPIAALLHLERVDPRFPCPRVVRTREGDTQCWYEDGSGARRAIRVLTYMPGKTLRSSTRSRAQRIAYGLMAARLGLALRDFTHPAARRPLIWDLRHVGKTLQLLGELPDLAERDTIAGLIELRGTGIVRQDHVPQAIMHYAVLPGSASGENRVPLEGEIVSLAPGFSLPALRLLTNIPSPLAVLMAKAPDIGC